MSAGGSTNPVILPDDIKFYLSGGYFNSEAVNSLGGPISQYAIASGTMHGLFDRVDTIEATEGDYEFRCVYIRNTSQTRKLLNTRIWVESPTTSATTMLRISIGSSGVNGTEPLISSEGNQPPMQFFEIPQEEPLEPNIGDLYPGDHIGLWIGWIVKPGTTSLGDDFAVLRIDGEREPESITTPLPPSTGTDPPPTGCPSGSKWSPTEGRCVDDNTVIICPNGYTYNSTTQKCVPPTTPPPSLPLFRFGIAGDFSCTSDNTASIASAKARLNVSPEDLFIGNGDLSYNDNNQQCWIDSTKALTGLYPDRIAITIGNHDDTEDGSAAARTQVIAAYPLIPPEGWYAITRRNIKFIFMDTQRDYDVGSAQHTFAVAQLQSAAADPAIKWKIVCYHKPSMISDTDHSILTDFRDIYHPLFDQYKVDQIHTGHAHVYFRSVPVKYSTSDPDRIVLASTQKAGEYINIDGRIYITNGTGGRRSNHNFGDAADYVGFRSIPPPYGVLFVTLEDNGNKLHSQYITNAGQVLDDFTQSKPGASPPAEITCPTGFHYDADQGRCIISPQQCPTGYTWSPAQNRCISNSGTPPPPDPNTPPDPMAGVEWYYDSTATQNTPQSIAANAYDSVEGIIISSQNITGASPTVISGGFIRIKRGTMTDPNQFGSIGIDYHKKARFTADDKPGFNTAFLFSVIYNGGNDTFAVLDGNSPLISLNLNRVFEGFRHSFIGPIPTGTPVPGSDPSVTNSVSTRVRYYEDPSTWTGRSDLPVASAFPGNRTLIPGNLYKVFGTYRTNRANSTVVSNVWMDFGDGSGWVKCVTDFVWSMSNWNPGAIVPTGYLDTTQIQTGPTAIKRHRLVIKNNADPGDPDLLVKDIKVGTISYLPETTTPPPPDPGGGGGGAGGGIIDSNGIKWMESSGQQGVIAQTRNQATDDRWSGNVDDVNQYGYQAVIYLTIPNISSDGHIGLKHWGPNHSGSCGHSEGGDCCCWYDCGLRENGDVYQEIERPHPNNDGWNKGKVLQNIGRGLGGQTTGVQWLVYPKNVGGDADNGGIRLKMWVDTAPFVNGKPANQWRLAYDTTDTGDILGDYPNPDYEHDIECRNSDSSGQTTYAGGLHWRKRTANDSRTT